MNLTFFNNYNNGDIHVSREFIKDIIKKTDAREVLYYHKNSNRILLDISGIKTINSKEFEKCHSVCNKSTDLFNINTFTINTWYRSNEGNYKKHGCTLKTLYENFKFVYNELKIEIEPEEFYIPTIDFSKYQIDEIDKFFYSVGSKKKIFISNCKSLSNQSPNIFWDNLILDLSLTFSDYLFFITNPTKIEKSNCIQNEKLIGNLDSDLCENAYISTFCDVIIGNNSGSHTFSYIKENILNNRNQINFMISFYPEFTDLYNHKSKKMISITKPSEAVKIISDKLINQ